MLRRQKTGSVVCPSCGLLVGVRDNRCYNCGRPNPGMWGFAPLFRQFGARLGFVQLVIGGCVLLYILSLVATLGMGEQIGMSGIFGILAPSSRSLILLGAAGSFPVFRLGNWLSVLSASWLHGSLLHIGFNMFWVWEIGPSVDEIYGTARTIIIYTVAGVFGFALSSAAGLYMAGPGIPFFLRGAQITIGASAAIFGLLGALVCYGRHGGGSAVQREAFRWAVILFVFGLIMPGVDNYAHLGGFVGGYLASMVLAPSKREGVDHVIVAVGCLAVTLLAVAASVVHILSLV
ncbi:MAG TPA: rhomboid family intramembrane serine protease [Vicinamibacterales bacterium]|nr:rhomboid family intramembrane serine protease [Vicinamibacterales bacterium]